MKKTLAILSLGLSIMVLAAQTASAESYDTYDVAYRSLCWNAADPAKNITQELTIYGKKVYVGGPNYEYKFYTLTSLQILYGTIKKASTFQGKNYYSFSLSQKNSVEASINSVNKANEYTNYSTSYLTYLGNPPFPDFQWKNSEIYAAFATLNNRYTYAISFGDKYRLFFPGSDPAGRLILQASKHIFTITWNEINVPTSPKSGILKCVPVFQIGDHGSYLPW